MARPFRRRLLYALVLALALQQAHGVSFSSRVNTSLLSLFTFTEGLDNTNAQYAIDQVPAAPLGRVKLAVPPASWDQTRVGISFPLTSNTPAAHRGVTELTTETLLNTFTSSDVFTYELWFEPTYDTVGAKTSEGMIAGFGQIAVGDTWIKDCVDPSYNLGTLGGFRIIQSSFNLIVQIIVDGNGSPSCALAQGSMSPSPTHLVLVYNRTATQSLALYVNNVKRAALGGFSTPYLPFWTNTTGGRTPFYFSPKWTNPSPSTILSDFWLGNVYLSAWYNRALSPAEVTQNYQAWLPNSPPSATSATVQVTQNTLTPIVLNGTDFDITSGRVSTPLTFTIMTLPSQGQLSFWNSTLSQYFAITAVPYAIVDSSRLIAYTPANNVVGGFSFTFKADDGTAVSKNTATLTLNVFRVNQPPVAVNSTQNAYAGGHSAITLVGTDPDPSDFVRAAYIFSLPVNGTLYQTNSSLVPLAPITSVPALVLDSSLRVLYRGPISASFSGQDYLLNDSFLFTVQDTNNRNSTSPGIQSVSLRNNLQPSTATASLLQDSNVTVQLAANDFSSLNQTVEYVLLTAPSGGGSIFINGTLVTSFPVTVPGGVFFYVAPPDVNGSPYESLVYRVQYPQSAPQYAGLFSANRTLNFFVGIVYHPPVIALKSPYVSPLKTTVNIAYTFSVSLTSKDPDTACLVRIETTGFGCVVAIANTTLFSQIRFRIGDGNASPSQTFQTSRTVAALALRELLVTNYVSGTRSIQITVDETDRGFTSELQIDVDSVDETSGTGAAGTAAAATYMIIAWAVIGSLCCCCCCCYFLKKHHDFKEHRHEEEERAREEKEREEREKMLEEAALHQHVCQHCAVKHWKAVAAQQIKVRTGKAPAWDDTPAAAPAEEEHHCCGLL